MKRIFLKLAFMPTLFGLVTLSACKRDDDDADDHHDHDEEELITTVELHLTNDASGKHTTATWADKDGAGGNAPVIDTVRLNTNAAYTVAVHFLDESGSAAHDLTHEIEEEATSHMVCYTASATALIIERTDSDGKHPIGLATKWETKGAATLSLTLALKHQPNVKDGSCAPGETDVEVVFPVVIK